MRKGAISLQVALVWLASASFKNIQCAKFRWLCAMPSSLPAGLKEPSATRIGRVCVECKIHLRAHCTAHRHFAKRQAEKWNGKLWLTVCFSNNAASGFASGWLRARQSGNKESKHDMLEQRFEKKGAERTNKRCLFCMCCVRERSKVPNYANAARAHSRNLRQKPLPKARTLFWKRHAKPERKSSLKIRRGVCKMQSRDCRRLNSQVLY